jgi:hypothetical protein
MPVRAFNLDEHPSWLDSKIFDCLDKVIGTTRQGRRIPLERLFRLLWLFRHYDTIGFRLKWYAQRIEDIDPRFQSESTYATHHFNSNFLELQRANYELTLAGQAMSVRPVRRCRNLKCSAFELDSSHPAFRHPALEIDMFQVRTSLIELYFLRPEAKGKITANPMIPMSIVSSLWRDCPVHHVKYHHRANNSRMQSAAALRLLTRMIKNRTANRVLVSKSWAVRRHCVR